MKQAASIFIGVLVFMGVSAGIRALNKPEVSSQATATTHRNSFISGCKSEGMSESFCSCGYEKLLDMYPDFATNEDRLNRIINDGYNQSETDAVVGCL